jgi:FKBP-type peptidyl-prolyl cis-trans isomerase FkpA
MPKKEGVITTESGLQYRVIKKGDGVKPKAGDIISVTYKGKTIDGNVFDEQDKPVEFPLDNMIPGWVEGLPLMNVGSEFEFYIPAKLAYGENGAGQFIKPNSVLIFEVKLVDVKKPEEKKSEEKKGEEKVVADVKAEEKKAEEHKADAPKADEKKTTDAKAE